MMQMFTDTKFLDKGMTGKSEIICISLYFSVNHFTFC